MCGLVGFLGPCDRTTGATLERMMAAIAHRGPDDDGMLIDEAAGLALGHRRLSVIDLSPLGHQPMTSASGRYVIAYNGEVYNFGALRAELAALGHGFRGHSDTEVVLAAVEQWGIQEAVTRFVGMFAFALWDRETRRLVLGRDRMGEKPLYYGRMGSVLLFGSELSALARHPRWQGEMDRDALALMLRHGYVPAPHSIYRGIKKLLPGTLLTLSIDSPELADPIPYWSAHASATAGIGQPFRGTDGEAVDELERLLRQSVRDQMVADVPVGVFLSGGVDSSAVAALAQVACDRPVQTFTIGFDEAAFDEAPHARAVARHLGTDHAELTVTPAMALEVIPRLPTLYDEPFSDVSQIPTLLLCQMARKRVTVALAGDGGDELFYGYSRYRIAADVWRRVSALPRPLRHTLAAAATALSPAMWNRLLGWSGPLLARFGAGSMGDKLHALAAFLTAPTPEAMYHRLISHWPDPTGLVRGSGEGLSAFSDPRRAPTLARFADKMMYLDMVSYLPDDILVKVDRASMGVSLETREPLLDHRVVEFAWGLDPALKLRDGQGKWALRQVLYRHVPQALVDRPKVGFGVPIDAWLRGPLRDWAETLLDERRLRDEGFLNPARVRQKWLEHLSGRRNWQYLLWDVLMFQAWLDNNRTIGLGR